MTSPHKELQRQQGVATSADIVRAAEGIEVNSFLVDLARRKGIKMDFAQAITEGYIERSMEGADVINITIFDPRREVIRSTMFGTVDNRQLPAIDVFVDGVWYRLASCQKEGAHVTLEFENRFVFYMKLLKTPMSASRNHVTRFEFIKRLVEAVRQQRIEFMCPELTRKLPLKKIEAKPLTEKQRQEEFKGGLIKSIGLKIKGAPATRTQLENCQAVLDAGSSMGANRKVLISSMMCIIQENSATGDKGVIFGGTRINVGLFQQTQGDGWPAMNNATKDAEGYFKVAIANDKANPRLTLAELVQSVQHSGAGASFYAQWREEAEAIVEEFGKGPKTLPTREHLESKEYDFHVGPPDGPEKENYWQASERLAKAVNARRFVEGNRFVLASDELLISRKAYDTISEEQHGIETINGVVDAFVPTNECKVECMATRWFAPAGSVIIVEECGCYNGRWIVSKVKRNLFTLECEVSLHQAEALKPEPNPTQRVEVSGEEKDIILGGHLSGGTARERIVEAAKWGIRNKNRFVYEEVRPMPGSLFGKPPIKTDCSGFATLCYKAANVVDPNGLGYNGQGYTGTLQSNRNSARINIAHIQEGDLVFYYAGAGPFGTAGHVAVYIGEGLVASMGGPGDPKELPINYASVAEARGYTLTLQTPVNPKPPKTAGKTGGKPEVTEAPMRLKNSPFQEHPFGAVPPLRSPFGP